jgi:hypothetical protein
MVFTITARDEEELKHLAGIEKRRLQSDSVLQYIRLKHEAQEIEKKNAWRKKLKKPLLEEVGVLPIEDWDAILAEPYEKVGSRRIPYLRF